MLMQPSTSTSAPSCSTAMRAASAALSSAPGFCLARSIDGEADAAHGGQQRRKPERAQPRGDAPVAAPGGREHRDARAELGSQMQGGRAGPDHWDGQHLAQRVEAGIAVAADDDRVEPALLGRGAGGSAPARRGPHRARSRSPRGPFAVGSTSTSVPAPAWLCSTLLAAGDLLRPDRLVHRARQLVEDAHAVSVRQASRRQRVVDQAAAVVRARRRCGCGRAPAASPASSAPRPRRAWHSAARRRARGSCVPCGV